jgi:nicotinate-nucleotide adenylyltransferase
VGPAHPEPKKGSGGDRPRRVGILGGTFDPIHVGHLVAACWAREALDLDRILMVVANQPWQKTAHRQVTAAEDRLAVVTAAVDGVPGLEPSRLEIDRGGPSYSVDTVRQLIGEQPDTSFTLVIGADVAPDLETWHDVAALAGLVTLAIVDRAGVPRPPDPAGWSVERVAIPALDVSSSELRDRLAAGSSVDFLIPAPAILCIRRLGLYAGPR